MMKCWICGEDATTGEHIPKASTMKDLFGNVTQRSPLYHSSAGRRNKRMQSIDSKLVKFRVLCSRCNSNITQPFDRAWDDFWAYLNKNGAAFKSGSVVRFYRVFGYRARSKTLNLHLYAVKLFGCVAAEFSVPLDLAGMAHAITHGQPYLNVYMGLGKRGWLKSLKFAGPSDLDTIIDKHTGKCVFAVWSLVIGEWEFQFIYAAPGQKREGLTNTWNPLQSRRIRLKKLSD